MDEIAAVMGRYCSDWELVREESERPKWLPAAVTEHRSVPVYIARGELKNEYRTDRSTRVEESGTRRQPMRAEDQSATSADPAPVPDYGFEADPSRTGATAFQLDYTPSLR